MHVRSPLALLMTTPHPRSSQSFANKTLERNSLIYSHLPLPDPDATSNQYYLFQSF